MKKILFKLTCVGLFLMVAGAEAGEKLVYTVMYKGEDFGMIKGEVFTIDPETGQTELIFSDDGTPIMLKGKMRMTPNGRLFAIANERSERGRRIHGRTAIYELSIDGSRSFRKVKPVSELYPFEKFFVNSTGTRTGCVKWQSGKQYILIHDTETGELVSEIDVSGVFIDCFPSTIGWFPDSDKLFFSLKTGADGVTSEESYDQVGCYIMDDTGGDVVRLDRLPTREGYRSPELLRLLGTLPTGEFIYAAAERDRENVNKRKRSLFRVSAIDADTLRVADISFGPEVNPPHAFAFNFELSPSGKYLAALNVLLGLHDTAKDLWLKDLDTGEEKIVFTFPMDRHDGPFPGIIGWIE